MADRKLEAGHILSILDQPSRRGSHPHALHPASPFCKLCSWSSLPASPESGLLILAQARASLAQLQEPGAGVPAQSWAGLGASSTSGIHYQRWLRNGLLCLPLTYLLG